MFYIRHGSDSFSIIDCCLPDERKEEILDEVANHRADKGICRFISTHPDQDHMSGLASYDDRFGIVNFYVVDNKATKGQETADFRRYKNLRDDTEKVFHMKRDCRRKWLNDSDGTRRSAGITIRWPIPTNEHFRDALKQAEGGGSPNNISPIIRYSLTHGASVMWMGDLETDFMAQIKGDITPEPSHVLFAPHHGRKSGRVPEDWLNEINPTIIVVGEAPSSDLTYYDDWATITQNSAGDIVFECLTGKTHVFVSKSTYSVDFLQKDQGVGNRHGCHYIGTFYT